MTEKGKWLQRFNEAFAKQDVDYILEQVTDDLEWKIRGDRTIRGKQEFEQELQRMKEMPPAKFQIGHIITHGNTAAVEGEMTCKDQSGTEKTYAFCDVYDLRGFKNPKIARMITFISEL